MCMPDSKEILTKYMYQSLLNTGLLILSSLCMVPLYITIGSTNLWSAKDTVRSESTHVAVSGRCLLPSFVTSVGGTIVLSF